MSRWRQHLRAGQLVAGVGRVAGLEHAHHAVGGVVGPDRLRARAPAPSSGTTGSSASRSRRCRRRSPGRVDQRAGERGRVQARRRHGPLRERLRAVHARVVVRRGAERRQPHEPLRPGSLGRPQQPRGGQPVDLLDRRARLVALGRRQVHDGSTPRSACRHDAGSDRSPIASCTRTRSAPSRRGSRTRQRTGSPPAARRRSTADPTSPVAPVSRSTPGSLESRVAP